MPNEDRQPDNVIESPGPGENGGPEEKGEEKPAEGLEEKPESKSSEGEEGLGDKDKLDESLPPNGGKEKEEPHPRSDVTVNAEAVTADKFTAIGQFVYHEGSGKKDEGTPLLLSPLPNELREKIEAIFVSPVGYKDFIDDIVSKGLIEHERVLIVYGPESAGKFTCAVKVALDLLGGERGDDLNIQLYRRTNRDTLSLLSLAQHSDIQKNSVYILQDAFANNVDLTEFSASYLSVINKGLQESKAHLILTTEEIPQLESLTVPQLSARVDREGLTIALDTHLERYGSYKEQAHVPASLIQLVREHADTLLDRFENPSQIDRFCHRLSRLPGEATENDLEKLADRVLAADQISARYWFQQFEQNNARLYAMLVVLFSGVSRFTLHELYTQAVKRLRQDGVSNLSDSREIGLDDMLDLIQAAETEEGVIRFEKKILAQEIKRQLHNHYHLLWSLVDYFLELIEEFKAPEHWEIRRDLGAAIGQLGIYHPHKLHATLRQLAYHESGGVVAAAGYALDEVCRSHPQKRALVLEILSNWVYSGDRDLMWAAGVSFWRVYDSFAEFARTKDRIDALDELWSILTEFGQTFNQFNNHTKKQALAVALEVELSQTSVQLNRSIDQDIAQRMQEQLDRFALNNLQSILHAFRQISREHSEDVVRNLVNWLQYDTDNKSPSNLPGLGQVACYQLFEENAKPSVLTQQKHAPFLELLHPLLSIETGSPEEEENISLLFQVMFNTLRNWLDFSDEWQERIYKSLLHIVNRANSLATRRLQACLSDIWVDSNSRVARELGQALLVRSYLMSGMPTTMPGIITGVIALDASRQARYNQIAARLARRIYSRFESQAGMYVVQMGVQETAVTPGQSVSSSLLQTSHARPRLLYPALHHLKERGSKIDFLVAFAWGEIADLEDVLDMNSSHSLILVRSEAWSVNAGDEEETYPSILFDPRQIHNRDEIEETLSAVESLITSRMSQAVATLESDDWMDALSDHLGEKASSLDYHFPKLNNWIRELDSLSSNKGEVDTARVILSSALWLAGVDLERCVALLLSWIEHDDEELFVRMAVAGSSALYRLYSDIPSPPVAKYEVLLSLLPPLSRTPYRWDVLKVALSAARQWARQPEWAERLSLHPDGTPGELLELIDSISARKIEKLLSILDQWTPDEASKSKIVPESVQRLVERLQLRIALGRQRALPELPDGHFYGLIAVDSSDAKRPAGKQLAEIAVELVKYQNQQDDEKLHLLVYQIGQSIPIAGPGDKLELTRLLSSSLGHRPPLFGPILDNYKPDQVTFLLLLTNRPPLDQEDWQHTHWNERILVYNRTENAAWTEQFTSLPWQDTTEEATKVITSNLSTRVGEYQ